MNLIKPDSWKIMEENQAGKTVESSLEAIKDWCFASFCTYTFLCACKTVSLTHELNQSPFAYTCFPAVLLLFGDRSLLPLLQTNNHSSLRDAHGSCTLLWPKMSAFWAGLAAKIRPREELVDFDLTRVSVSKLDWFGWNAGLTKKCKKKLKSPARYLELTFCPQRCA